MTLSILQSQFSEKDFKKTENLEHSVALLGFCCVVLCSVVMLLFVCLFVCLLGLNKFYSFIVIISSTNKYRKHKSCTYNTWLVACLLDFVFVVLFYLFLFCVCFVLFLFLLQINPVTI